ncbi:hypothetical protein [Cerasicoccus frondis]|uniref:hypothetical protein n=1 Tax=Cerasicoccus frondis TaxID=490090 RepID=UPI0028524A45|nr:hypothetical protein [Cerasicoccus frondis]
MENDPEFATHSAIFLNNMRHYATPTFALSLASADIGVGEDDGGNAVYFAWGNDVAATGLPRLYGQNFATRDGVNFSAIVPTEIVHQLEAANLLIKKQ